MRNLLIVALGMMLVACGAEQSPQGKALFGGDNLEGWAFALEKDVDVEAAASVFQAEDGVIKVAGMPFGYLYTAEQYDAYKLSFEWRWVGEGSNSGVFIHVQNPGEVWPRAYEYQLMAGKAGDMVLLGGAELENFKGEGEFPIKPRKADCEKSVGEWNKGEIVVKRTLVQFYTNGKLQNEAITKFEKGHIALQSEGGALEFRNIYIESIK